MKSKKIMMKRSIGTLIKIYYNCCRLFHHSLIDIFRFHFDDALIKKHANYQKIRRGEMFLIKKYEFSLDIGI